MWAALMCHRRRRMATRVLCGAPEFLNRRHSPGTSVRQGTVRTFGLAVFDVKRTFDPPNAAGFASPPPGISLAEAQPRRAATSGGSRSALCALTGNNLLRLRN